METSMQFFVRSDLVVTGYDAEFADATNPRGALYGQALYVVAEAHDGRRWAHDHLFVASRRDALAVLARAERLCSRIQAAYDAGRRLDQAHWREIDPAYGSDAYVAQDVEAERARQERNQDA
jgi:hypothetical protein